MKFKCVKCGWESCTMVVRCKGIGCGLPGTMQAVQNEEQPVKSVSQQTVVQQAAKLQPTLPRSSVTKDSAAQKGVSASGVALKNIVTANPSSRLTPPTQVVKQPLLAHTQPTSDTTIASVPQSVVLLRSDTGRAVASAVQKAFEEHGLWLRSVQFKNCQCVTEPNIPPLDEKTRSVKGLYADSWTYAHPSIAQYLFQMHPTEGKRAVALIVDWKKTAERFVEYALKDMSSNKRFGDKDVAKTEDETARDMEKMRRELANKKAIEHNEVRTCQIHKEALVGLIWSPILNPTALSDGGMRWEEQTKPKFINFVKKLQTAGAAKDGLPIFSYEVSAAGMTLTYIDFIA